MSRLRRNRWPLGRALVLYMLLLCLVVTLAPFRFFWPPDMVIGWSMPIQDLIYNILFFIPLGFLYRLTQEARTDRWHLQALGLGLGFSAFIEITQLFLPGRVTSFSDVAANGIGMWLGSFLHDRVQSRVDGWLLARLTLELPLLILVYLLIPLMWINARAARVDPDRIWLQSLLGIVGAIVLAALRIHRAGPVARLELDSVLMVVASWFAISSIPAFVARPKVIIASGLVTVAVAALILLVPRLMGKKRRDRRFELPTLVRIAPIYLTYLVMLALWPWPKSWQAIPWEGAWGLREMKDFPGDVAVLQLLEYTTSFTILGYVIGQSRGRIRESRTQAMVIVAVLCTVIAGSLEIVRGYHPGHYASFVQLILCVGAGTFGGFLYQAQLATIRQILAR